MNLYHFICLGDLLAAINKDFGSVDAMKAQLSAATVAVQGSGWGWLGFNKQKGSLQIATCANQVCILGIAFQQTIIFLSLSSISLFSLSLYPLITVFLVYFYISHI